MHVSSLGLRSMMGSKTVSDRGGCPLVTSCIKPFQFGLGPAVVLNNPENWGLRLEESKFIPIMTDKSPAPEELLNVIRCNCQLTSKNLCGGKSCSCRANGLNCVAACGDCCGTECNPRRKC